MVKSKAPVLLFQCLTTPPSSRDWSFNVGTGINAPPMTYAVDGRQYIAIATGLTRNSMGRLATTPEKRNLGKSATMIFVFAL
jgi:alcohol dehydrogenase (cytochrome c)